MLLWLDEFAPNNFADLRESAGETSSQFEIIARACATRNNDIPHLVIHGPNGAGKTLRARLLLSQLYGQGVTKNCRFDVLPLDNGKYEFTVFGSQYHTEINAADLGIRDRQFIQQLIKELAGHASTAALVQSRFKCRVFVIHEAHRLSFNAQAALRRTMERHSQTSRIFLLTERLSNLIAPLRSRCVCIAVPAPTLSQTREIISTVALKAGASVKNEHIFDHIPNLADGSLRRALVLMEQSVIRSHGSQACILAWQKCVGNIVSAILKRPSVSEVLACRPDIHYNNVYNLEGQFFLENIAREFLRSPNLTYVKKVHVAEAAAYFSNAMAESSRDLFHIEGFVCDVARIIASS